MFIADLIACSTCFWHHYVHHQELESIIQVVAACGIWSFGFQVVGMVWSWGLCVRFAGCCLFKHVEQAIRSAIKIIFLHLVGILFPHINDDARSKSHQNYINRILMGACLYVLTLSGTFSRTKCKEKLAALNVYEEASSAINSQSKFCSLPANEYVSKTLRISPSS